MGSEMLHEHPERLGSEVVDTHRAIVSLMEELEAVDWYNQRVAACDDPALAAILAHNRDEEKEHASMVLEYLRRNDVVLDTHLRTYLFTDEAVTEIEAEDEGGAGGAATRPPSSGGSLRIGSLREVGAGGQSS